LPSWQANNFSDLNFSREIFADFQKWRENCGSVDRLSAWKFFGFFNGICEAEKEVRDLGRAVPGSCGNFHEKNNLGKVKNREKSGILNILNVFAAFVIREF
jgi:hypothetical protein